MRYILMLLPIFIGCSVTTKTESETKQKITVLDSAFVTPVMIYLLDEEVIDESVIKARIKTLLPGFSEVDSVSSDVISDQFRLNNYKRGDEGFMELDMALLNTFMQLSAEEKIALEKADRTVEVIFVGNRNDIVNKQRQINQLIYDVTQHKNAIIVDLSTYEFFNSTLWKEKRVAPFEEEPLNITSQVAIHAYREGAFCRAVTLGMNKFCLPEISVKDFPCSDQNSFGNLINATIQTLLENPGIDSDSTLEISLENIRNAPLREFLLSSCIEGAAMSVNIRLKQTEREEGDNYATQLLIAFENSNYSSAQEEASKVVSTLFGSEDSLVYTNHDEELLKASERARQKFPQLKQQFNAGLAPGYSLMVKIPFETDSGGNEWMWVEVTKWEESSMEGILQNDPFEIKNLKAGNLITFHESDIFDYLLSKPDGSVEGNETGRILENRGK